MKIFYTIVMLLIFVLLSGCYPVYTTNKLPIEDSILPLKDEITSANIKECIIIPLYITAKGFSSGAGHGPGSTKDLSFFAHSFFYFKDNKFKPHNGKASGIRSLMGTAWIGKSTDIYGLLVISQGYYPKMIFNVRSIDKEDEDYYLKPATKDGVSILNANIIKLINNNVLINTTICDFIKLPKGTFAAFAPIEIRLTSEEKQEIKKYVIEGVTAGGKDKEW